jgi:translation initiation factor 1
MPITVRKETAGRRGKVVTLIKNIQHNPQVIEDLAKQLKQQCGAGGTVKGKTIEIQGDHVNKITEYLKKNDFNVK